jgi:hypothetical protein
MQTEETGDMNLAKDQVFQSEWIVVESPAAVHEAELSNAVLVCDIREKTILCSQAAAYLFGGQPADLEDVSIAALLPELGQICASEHYFNHAGRTLAYYCNMPGWQRFNAVSPVGANLQVEANVTKFEVDEIPLFLLQLRPVFHA